MPRLDGYRLVLTAQRTVVAAVAATMVLAAGQVLTSSASHGTPCATGSLNSHVTGFDALDGTASGVSASKAWVNTSTARLEFCAEAPSGQSVAAVELWVKEPGDSAYANDATFIVGSPAESVTGTLDYQFPVSGGEGEYRFYTVAVIGPADREAAPGADTPDLSLVLDRTDPDTSITAGPTGRTGSDAATFEFSANEVDSTFECRLDGPGATTGSFGPCSSPESHTSLADGSYTFSVRAIDRAGNDDPSPATRAFTVDTTAPALTVDLGTPASPMSDPTPNLQGAAGDAAGDSATVNVSIALFPSPRTFALTRTGTGWTITDADWADGDITTPDDLADGPYTAEVTQADDVGNEATVMRSFTVDTEPPTAVIESGPTGLINDTTPTFSFSSDVGSTFECQLDGPGAVVGSLEPCTSPEAYGPLSDGSYSFNVRATDEAGNTGGFATRAFELDGTPPDTAITGGPSGATSDESPSFTFTSEGSATFECKLDPPGVDAGTWDPCSSPQDYVALTDGAYEFAVRATDAAANTDPTPATRSFTISSTVSSAALSPAEPVNGPFAVPYEVYDVLGDPVADPTAVGVSRVVLFASVPGSSQFNSVGTDTNFADGLEFAYTPSAGDGDYRFFTIAYDNDDNPHESKLAADSTTEVDTSAPDTTIDLGPSGRTAESSPGFEFSADELGSSFECQLDGPSPVAWEPCGSPKAYAGLADGAYILSVRATDEAGNTDASPATREFTVDTTAPAVGIDSDEPASPTSDSTPNFFGPAGDAVGDDPTVTVGVWAGTDTAVAPLHSFTLTRSGDQWSLADADWIAASASLTDGSYTVGAEQSDDVGNASALVTRSFTVDTIEPETGIVSGPSLVTNDASPTFVFASDEPGSTFECKLDGPRSALGAFGACASPKDYTDLADGSYVFSVKATDAAGNGDGTPATASFTIDTAPPAVTIDSDDPASPTNDPTPNFSGAAGDAVGDDATVTVGVWAGTDTAVAPLHSFALTRSGAEWSLADADWTAALASLSDALYTVGVEQTDDAGNTGLATRAFTVDTVAPDTSITSGPVGLTNDASPTFDLASDEPGSTFECKLDGPGPATGSYEACASPTNYTTLGDGDYTLSVKATDAAGNTDGSPATRSFAIDTTDPETTIDSGPSGPTNDDSPEFMFSSDESASFECRLDGPGAVAWEPCSAPKAYPGLADGAYTLHVRATDDAGNTDASAATREFEVDTMAPDTSITSGPTGLTNDASPSFAFASDDPPSSFECKLDPPGPATGSYEACASPKEYLALGDGDYTLSVRATDEAGNTDATSATRAFTVDTTPAETTIDSGPAGVSNDSSPQLVFSSEPGASFECKLDGPGAATGEYQMCSSPHDLPDLADGSYVFSVKATDSAGNTDDTPATRGFSVDTAAPDTSITSGPSGATNDATPTFGFAGEAGSSFECKLDGPGGTSGTFEACTSPKEFAALADGSYVFSVRATDTAGNVDGTPADRSFTVDTSPPDTTVVSGPPGLSNDTSPSFAFSSEAGSSFECKLDGPAGTAGAYEACTSPRQYSGLADGAYAFSVRAADPSGNTDGSPAVHAFTIDTTAPETTITSGPSGPTDETSPSFAFTSEAGAAFQCRIDGPGGATRDYEACASPKVYPALPPGEYEFSVRANDGAGNVDATPATRAFTVGVSPASMGIRNRSLPRLIRRGVGIRLNLGKPSAANIRLLLSRRTVRSLRGTTARRNVKLGAARTPLLEPGTRTVRVKLTRRGKRILRRAEWVRLTIRVTLVDAAGERTKLTRRVRFNR